MSSRSARRSVDKESRKPRVTYTAPHEPVEDVSDNEEMLSELEIEQKDDTTKPLVKRSSAPPSKKKSVARSRPAPNTEKDIDVSPDEDEKDEGHSVAPALALLLATSLHLSPSSMTFPSPSFFIPAFWNMFFVLDESQRLVFENNWMLKVCPYYNSLFTTIYYAIISSVHILRARVFAGANTTSEGKFFRSFEKQFPLESLPVSGPMAGFFQVLGALKFNDAAYGWLVPSLPGLAVKMNEAPTGHGYLRFPSIPHLVQLFRNYVEAWSDDDEDVEFTGTNLVKFGDANFGAAKASLLLTPGFLRPHFSADQLGSFRRVLTRLSLPTINDDTSITSLEAFLCFPKDGEHSWFNEFIKVATFEAEFFEGSTNLGAIPPAADLSLATEVLCYGAKSTGVSGDEWKNKHFAPDRFPSVDDFGAIHRIPDTSTQQFQLGLATSFLLEFQSTTLSGAVISHLPAVPGPFFDNTAEAVTKHGIRAVSRPSIKMCEDSFKNPIRSASSFMVGKMFREKGRRTKA